MKKVYHAFCKALSQTVYAPVTGRPSHCYAPPPFAVRATSIVNEPNHLHNDDVKTCLKRQESVYNFQKSYLNFKIHLQMKRHFFIQHCLHNLEKEGSLPMSSSMIIRYSYEQLTHFSSSFVRNMSFQFTLASFALSDAKMTLITLNRLSKLVALEKGKYSR